MVLERWTERAAAGLMPLLPARVQLAHRYRHVNGRAPDLRSPRLLSERILQRVLWDRDPQLRIFCDKIACKQWIDDRIGSGHTPRTLAIADRAERLPDLALPERWILKASHGSGWFQLVDSTTHPLDGAVLEVAREWLARDHADGHLEWGYRGLPRRLIAEEWLSTSGGLCTEVSAFCFRGRVAGLRLFQVDSALAVHRGLQKRLPRTKECFLDESLRVLPLIRPHCDHEPELAERDQGPLQAFLALARELSATTPFLRVDGFLSDEGVLVGELTPYPGAGVWLRMPRPWDAWFGAFWD